MYEPATDSTREFAPSQSTCRNKWYRMTDMRPSEVHVTGVLRRGKQRKQLEHAFERYQSRQAQSTAGTENIPVHSDASQVEIEGARNPSAATLSTERSQTLSMLSPPPLTFDSSSPNDPSALTPAPQDPLRLGIALDESSSFTASVIDSLDNRFGKPSQNTSARGIEALVSTDSSDSGKGTAKISSLQPPASIAQAHSVVQANRTSVPSSSEMGHAVTTLSAMVDNANKATPSKITRKTVDQVEDEEGIPRGLINFVKYQLTKSRWSVISTIPEPGSGSDFSNRHSGQQSSEGTGLLGIASIQHTTLACNCIGGSATAQSQSGLLRCSLEPNLFEALRAAGATDNKVATRLKELLNDKGAEETKEIVKTRSCLGETALQVALGLGNVPACRFLLEAGADVSALTSDGRTLSEYGRIAMANAIDNIHYFAIGACKNTILSDPILSTGVKKSRNATNPQRPTKRPRQTPSGSWQDESPLGHHRTGGTSFAKSIPISSQPQESCQTPKRSSSVVTNIDDMANVGNSSADRPLITGSNPGLRLSATSKPGKPQRPPTAPSQAILPVVPSLVKHFDGLGPEGHLLSSSTTSNTLYNTQPNLTPNGLDSGYAYGYSTGLAPSTVAEDSASRGNKLTDPESAKLSVAMFGLTHPPGQWERLLDDRLAFIPHCIPCVDDFIALTQDPQFSYRPLQQKNPYREAGIVDMGDSFQIQYQWTPKNSEQSLTQAGMITPRTAQPAGHTFLPRAGDDMTMTDSFQDPLQLQLQNPLLSNNASLRTQICPGNQTPGFRVVNNQDPTFSNPSNTMNGLTVDTNDYFHTPFYPNVISGMESSAMSRIIKDDRSIPPPLFDTNNGSLNGYDDNFIPGGTIPLYEQLAPLQYTYDDELSM